MRPSLENLFGVPHLGYAGQYGLQTFGAEVFTQPSGTPVPPKPRVSVKNVPGKNKCLADSFKAKIKRDLAAATRRAGVRRQPTGSR